MFGPVLQESDRIAIQSLLNQSIEEGQALFSTDSLFDNFFEEGGHIEVQKWILDEEMFNKMSNLDKRMYILMMLNPLTNQKQLRRWQYGSFQMTDKQLTRHGIKATNQWQK